MRRTRIIYLATGALLLLIGTASVVIYRASERDAVRAYSDQQLAVARTVAVALEADAKTLAASLRQLNSLPSVQRLEVPYIGERVQAAFEPDTSGVLRHVVRIGHTRQRYAWSVHGQLLEDGLATPADSDMWNWFADRAHAGEVRVSRVWWDDSAPAHYRALAMPVWRVASSDTGPVPSNDFNGAIAFVIDARRLLGEYAQPAAIDATDGSLSLEVGDHSKFHIGRVPLSEAAYEQMHRQQEGTSVVDGYAWAWAHLPFADATWGVTIGTPYSVAAARVGESGLRQLGLVGVLLVLVPVVGWLLVRRERAAEEERHALHLQLAEAQKLDAIGKLAGSIAHDFNNLLTAILGYTTIILEDVPAGTPVHEQAAQVRRAAESAAALTRKLLAFSRRQVLHSEHIDAAQLLNDIMSLVRRLVGEHIDVMSDLEEHIWPVIADRVQVEQAVINLAVNARDAMPRGGKLEIIARNAPRPLGERRADQEVQPGDYVQIIVRDTGVGMDEPTRRRMFEPFFTTKPKGKGTGLGLSSVWGIVKQSGGYIDVASTPGAGTTIELLLPRATKEASPVQARKEAPDEARGTETVLVVDDEPRVLEFACAALQRQGYHVLKATSPDEAIRIAHEHRGRISLLLTDVRMPGIQGPELATRLRLMRPGLRVLFMSGYAAEGITNEMLKDTALLEKPFMPAALTRAVRAAIDRA